MKIRLGQIAHARSGDKGAGANVGVIAYTDAGYELLRASLTAARVETFFKPMGVGKVIRYELSNLLAFNFILPDILDRGGSLSLRIDAQGKALGQAILELELEIPGEMLDKMRAQSMSDILLIDDSDPAIRIVSLNRPDKRNALNIELIECVTSAVEEAQTDLNRRVIVIRGEGPSFCAGLDLKEASDPSKAHGSAVSLCELYKAICESPLITIASAHGVAMGGGAGIVSACDFAIVSDDFRIAYPEVHRGLVAALVTTLLRRQLNDRQVRELVLLGQSVDALNSLELGLVNRVVPGGRLLQSAMELARESCKGAPGAISRSKRLLDDLAIRSISLELKRSMEYHLGARDSAEAQEGVAAFLEKRPPRWGPRPAHEPPPQKEH